MKRAQFVKSLIGIYGIAHLPLEAITQYEKVYLKQCFIRGFSYYDGPKIIDEINTTGMVQLVREPDNEYDNRAIAIYFEGKKIGYLPRESNKTISILMDTNLLEFHAEITHIEKSASDWEKIRLGVFALKEITSPTDLEQIKPYNVLATPHYYTINNEQDNFLTRFSIEDEEEDELWGEKNDIVEYADLEEEFEGGVDENDDEVPDYEDDVKVNNEEAPNSLALHVALSSMLERKKIGMLIHNFEDTKLLHEFISKDLLNISAENNIFPLHNEKIINEVLEQAQKLKIDPEEANIIFNSNELPVDLNYKIELVPEKMEDSTTYFVCTIKKEK